MTRVVVHCGALKEFISRSIEVVVGLGSDVLRLDWAAVICGHWPVFALLQRLAETQGLELSDDRCGLVCAAELMERGDTVSGLLALAGSGLDHVGAAVPGRVPPAAGLCGADGAERRQLVHWAQAIAGEADARVLLSLAPLLQALAAPHAMANLKDLQLVPGKNTEAAVTEDHSFISFHH